MSEVLTDITDGVGTITLNRPQRRNALSATMVAGLSETLEQMESSQQVGCIVLTGAGGAFCSGGDVQDFDASGGAGGGGESDSEAVEQQRHHQEQTVGRIYQCPKPVIAALPGAVAGAGIGLALAADLRIGTPSTVFATAFAGIGLSGDFGVAWLLHHLVGPAKARELMFSPSPRLRGEECLTAGLLNWMVEDAQLPGHTQETALRLAHGPSAALKAMKQNLLEAPHRTLTEAMGPEVSRHKAVGATEEHIDAVRAFVEKRTPVFAAGWHEGSS